MCGIFGIISNGACRSSRAQARKLIESFYVLSESRGKEAAGVSLLHGSGITVLKAPVRGRDFLRLREAQPVFEDAMGAMEEGCPFVLIGHTRMVTNGGDHVHGNNQPVRRDGLVAIHNGIIVNEDALWKAMPEEHRYFEVDTEVALALVSQRLRDGLDLGDALAAAMRDLKGANSFALLSSRHDGVALATSNGSMFVATEQAGGLSVFASERSILEHLIEDRLKSFALLGPSDVAQLWPGELAVISLSSPRPERISWQDHSAQAGRLPPAQRTVADEAAASIPPRTPWASQNRSHEAAIEAAARINWDAIRHLRRCTRCVLPETFPFIRFDADGVCNFCNSYHPTSFAGEDALRRELEAIRRTDGRPEILMPLSGGRDSCYGLHLLAREFGMKPVAYTYDWGMVTDLARRNISRMCGQLGIEHILISADIRKKREYVRKNVAAWLKTPHLGTVPLFMAGDKQFFHYANMLKKAMGLSRTMLSVNPLERTDFKVGFCGLDESQEKEHYHDLAMFNKVRLALFYGKQFLLNPAYINASLFDSVYAFFSYYLIPKDFTSVFDYVPWHEHEVESVLLNQYDWEISPDTRSTWRIGDGTAAFYNYIYLKMAGFTENDTFRSNQIREGLMTREQAMSRIYEDNLPRIASIAWYFDAIGLDAQAALAAVNRARPLHPGL